MAVNVSKDNESRGFNPKQRVIGAVILVVLAIVIVPLVLNKREPPADAGAPTAQTVIADLPPAGEIAPATPPATTQTPPPSSPPQTTTMPLPDVAPNPPAASGTLAADAPRANAAAPAPAKLAAPEVSANKPAAKDLARESTLAAKGWYVQVGTFSNPTNAEQLAARLKKADFKVVLERVKVESNTVVRVRVGPYAKEAQAKTGQTRVHKAVGIKGLVRHY